MSEARTWQNICEENYPVMVSFLEKYGKGCSQNHREELYDCMVEILIHASQGFYGKSADEFAEGLIQALENACKEFCARVGNGGKIHFISFSDPALLNYPAYSTDEMQAAA